MAKSERTHKSEQRWQKVVRFICVEPRCKYRGQERVQGHCHTVIPDATTRYIDSVMAQGEGLIREMRASRKQNGCLTDKKYIARLESYVITEWANHWFTLDELVMLRSRCAALTLQNKTLRQKGHPHGKV